MPMLRTAWQRIPPRWRFLLASFLIGLVIFTILNIGMLTLAASQMNPDTDVPWLKFVGFVLYSLIGGPILLAISFNPLSPRNLSGAPSWGQYLLTNAPIPIIVIAMMLAHPVKQNRRNATLTILGVILWFLVGSAAVGIAIT